MVVPPLPPYHSMKALLNTVETANPETSTEIIEIN